MSYIDTSVLVAYYCPEPLTPRVQKVLASIDQPTISPLIEVELISALAIKLRTGALDQESAHAIVTRFKSDLADQRFCQLPVQRKHFELAAQWIGQFDSPLRSLDGLHLALAYSNDIRLLTADKTLAACAKHFQVSCKCLQ